MILIIYDLLYIFSFLFAGGWCNNPTAIQFIAAFRKLIARAGACPSGKTGNVVAQDSTEIVMAATSTYVPPNNVRMIHDDDERPADAPTLTPLNSVDQSNGHIDPRSHATAVLDNILVYISGFVVRKAIDQISCRDCAIQLVGVRPTLPNSHLLLSFKNRGGLCVPSEAGIKIVQATEKVIRRTMNLRELAPSCPKRETVATAVVSVCGSIQLFNLSHEIETRVGIDNHSISLIRILAGIYYDIRLYHIARLQNCDVRRENKRNKLTRTAIFLGL